MISSEDGADLIVGGEGDDNSSSLLFDLDGGNDGSDEVHGNAGDDDLDGGPGGNDICSPGSGNNVVRSGCDNVA